MSENFGPVASRRGLEVNGLKELDKVYWNLPAPALYEQAIARGEARIAQGGPLIANTGQHTGRSPKDKFIADEAGIRDNIWWGRCQRRDGRGALRAHAPQGAGLLQGP